MPELGVIDGRVSDVRTRRVIDGRAVDARTRLRALLLLTPVDGELP